MDKNKFSREVLMEMNLLELRDLARELGVPSPTVLKKMSSWKNSAVINGDVEPAKKSKGRPPSPFQDRKAGRGHQGGERG